LFIQALTEQYDSIGGGESRRRQAGEAQLRPLDDKPVEKGGLSKGLGVAEMWHVVAGGPAAPRPHCRRNNYYFVKDTLCIILP
jgi:hypothetical protein